MERALVAASAAQELGHEADAAPGAIVPPSPEVPRAEPRLRTIVADDDPFARRMLKDLLLAAGMLVVAEALDGRQAVELTRYYRPDIVLVDAVMPELDGIATTRRIVRDVPGQVVVVLSSADDDAMALLALRAGASGFLSKNVDVGSLPRAIRSACNGEAVFSRRLGMRLIESLRDAPSGARGIRPVKSPLTVREWEVIDLLCEGRTTEQMAASLVLSRETVRSHVKNILRKLDVRSRDDAVAVAQRMRGGQPVRGSA